ncbi:MAG TPA: PH domain-containing protein [Candidatus Aenigmarchaeota archaeon]|nr:PH domain-containing protein [Candidatus Aenigmarchaeota archaeon]
MELRLSPKALLVWFFEKGPFFVFLSAYFLYQMLGTLESLPYVYNSHGLTTFFITVLVSFPLISMLHEYKSKRYYLLEKYVHVRTPFGVKRVRISSIRDVKEYKTPLHKFLGVSDLIIVTKRGKVIMEGIEHPEKVEKVLAKKLSRS